MGCRPSRRAVVCVRVAGEGPWGAGRSTRPRTSSGDSGVRLRHRSNKHSRDEGRNESEGVGNPRDRYSAPPVDRQFPPHSCTSATYEHGCCGTSRITLRLSKNGSTLEIEKCDFHHSVKSCHLCGTPGAQNAELHRFDIPLRTQSAPNLSMTRPTQNKTPTSPPSSQRISKQAVDSVSHPLPTQPRHMKRLFTVPNSKGGSPPGSVCTATKIDVDVESIRHSQQSSRLGVDSGFHDIGRPTYPARTNTSNEIQVSHESTRNNQRVRPEKLHTFKESPYSKSSRNETQRYDSQVQNENFLDYSYSYSPSSEDLCKLLRDTEHLLMNDYVDTETVDLTKLESTNPGSCEVVADIECPSRQDGNHLKASEGEQHEAGEASGCLGLEREITCPNTNNMNGHNMNNETDCTDITCCDDCSDSIATFTASNTNSNSSLTGMAASTEKSMCHNDGQFVRGATDYRIRMLGAQKYEITSHLTDTEAVNYHMSSALPHVSDGKMILASCDDHVFSRENNSRVISELKQDHDVIVDGNETIVANGSQEVHQTKIKCKDGQVAQPVASVSEKSAKIDFYELTDQSCMAGGNRTQIYSLQELETSPAFFEADV